jgi:GrpB-like predicted nucleotidyltransferase (UPF0157 family)
MIRLVPVGPAYAAAYVALRDRLSVALGDEVVSIRHVGSTSVPGFVAKPIIDVLVRLRRRQLPPEVIAAVCDLGLEHRGEFGLADRTFFVSADAHVHCWRADHPECDRHERFAAYLRADADARGRYLDVKRDLAARLDDRGMYADQKSSIIQALDREASAWWRLAHPAGPPILRGMNAEEKKEVDHR